jgi:hypothetical protein
VNLCVTVVAEAAGDIPSVLAAQYARTRFVQVGGLSTAVHS